MHVNTLAIDIGGTKCTMAIFENNTMLCRETHLTDRTGGRDWMLQHIVATTQTWQHNITIHRCGVGFGGPVNFATQRIALSVHVGGWQDFALATYLEQQLGIPTVMDNDANAGALGEALYGAGVGCDPLFYITLSTGVGGGFIMNQQIYRGADSGAGEVGHITIQPDGPSDQHGMPGSVERLCSGFWLERDYGQSAQELLQNEQFMQKYVVDLACGMKAVILLLNPACIIIGGGISKAGAALFDPLRHALRECVPPWSPAHIDVRPAALGDDSVLYGALALAQT
ncbi:MAG: ROK family protein [Chloroflexi bacterium AL-W]|nr:ROK family protein [Chloroflexi bacterium AL-N1]NOK67628.1 ROK family protein [Chloroflexi bacterium AL-N10]NOK75602.1 ROK family protein [Chloroflexi bacterium AL-N5]NOK82390.1 ROK family protein [Chloroflexi bacterium AL-W]NOK90235.1 ROK family protein [Chloroflexi bacterium AL-N15]